MPAGGNQIMGNCPSVLPVNLLQSFLCHFASAHIKMPSITVLRGFKLPVAVLDAFLIANGLMETFGRPSLPGPADDIEKLLRSKMGDGEHSAQVFIPQHRSFDPSSVCYVAYAWRKVFAQRELHLAEDLPEAVPAPFLALREELLSFADREGTGVIQRDEGRFGAFGLFVVFAEDRSWIPDELWERNKVSSYFFNSCENHC